MQDAPAVEIQRELLDLEGEDAELCVPTACDGVGFGAEWDCDLDDFDDAEDIEHAAAPPVEPQAEWGLLSPLALNLVKATEKGVVHKVCQHSCLFPHTSNGSHP
jgi:hypothetical protein